MINTNASGGPFAVVSGGDASGDQLTSGSAPTVGTAPVAGAPGGGAEPESGLRPLATFDGSGWELFTIHLLNAVFTVLTLGIYSFWGKVKIRRYLWEHTSVLGESLEYTGTGGELFRSFLLVMALALLGMAGYYACSLVFPLAAPFILPVVLVPFGFFAGYQALRYRLTRTRWRGIRGNMDGSALRYAAFGVGYSLLSLATLFICRPLETARLTGMRVNAAYFGSRRCVFTGSSRPLFSAWLKSYCLLALLVAVVAFLSYTSWENAIRTDEGNRAFWGYIVSIVIISLPLAWLMTLIYRAAVTRWLFANLAFGNMRFDARSYTAWRLFKLTLGNAFLLVVTLGIAFPWTELRSLRFFLSSIRYTGEPDFAALLQDTLPERSGGEGLLDALDVDLAM